MPEDDYAEHINQMERERQQQIADLDKQKVIENAAIERAKYEAHKARWNNFGAGIGFLALALAIVGVSYIIWQGVAGPSANELLMQEDRQQCTEHGGTWNYVDAAEDVVSCIMPGVSSK